MNTDNIRSFKCQNKLLGNTEENGENGILRNTTISVILNSLSNIWVSLEMSLINSKVELKFKWKNQCVLCNAGNDNANSNNIVFTIKETKLYIPVPNLFSKGYKSSPY